jgi:hypothetical protein
MSGQRKRNPTDASKFRQTYLANLALEANINDRNLQANKIFKKTGVAPNQLTDQRTTAEKLADVERLKIDLRSQLGQIMDGENANAFVEATNVGDLTFLAQHIEEIVKDIKPKYKYGITADIFARYLDSYIQRAQQTNEVNFGLQQAAGANLILGVQQILGDMIRPQDLQMLARYLRDHTNDINRQLYQALMRDISALIQVLPTAQDLQAMENTLDANTRNMFQQELNDALQNVPTRDQMTDMIRDLQQSIARNDVQRSNQVADALRQILAMNPATQRQLESMKQELSGQLTGIQASVDNNNIQSIAVEDSLRDIESGMFDMAQTSKEEFRAELEDALKAMGVRSRAEISTAIRYLTDKLGELSEQQAQQIVDTVLLKLSQKVDDGKISKRDISDAVEEAEAEELGGGGGQVVRARPLRPKQITLAEQLAIRNLVRPSRLFLDATEAELRRYVLELQRAIPEQYRPKTAAQLGLPRGSSLTSKTKKPELLEVAKKLNELAEELAYGNEASPFDIEGYGLNPRMMGRGLSRKVRENVLPFTDFSKGIMPQDKYVPIGKHFIDHHRLNDDIINIKRHNGVNISGIPVRRVSKHMGEVMRTIIGNGIPSYNQIDKLTEDEKKHLHKIAKETNILDRLHIPSPTKEEDDQDINQFEVLKGEILCGNDGSETIKKFKLLIMRMMNKGLLPKGQAREILLELATLGH